MTVQGPFKSILKHPDEIVGGDDDIKLVVDHLPSQLQQSDHPPPLYKQRTRKVHFHKTILNRRIPHLNDMSQRLREAVWIQPDEYLEIRQRCIATLRIMAMGEASVEMTEGEDFCPRGLEGKTREGAMKRREYKLDSMNAVLEEQQILWNEEIEDDVAIMEAYQVFSIPCAEDAYERGAMDEDAIQDYLMEDPYMGCKSSSQLLAPSLLENISDILFMQIQRSALLKEIEDNFYEESSIERRKKCEETYSYKEKVNRPLAKGLREFFSEMLEASKHRSVNALELPRPNQDDDLPSLAWDEEDSCNCSSLSFNEPSMDSFTSELSGVFHSRKKRQSFLLEIERNYFIEPTIVSERHPSMPSIAHTLKSGLSFFGTQEASNQGFKDRDDFLSG